MREIKINGIKLSALFTAYIIKERVAVVADLHIGYEGVMQREGVMIPKYQKDVLLERLGRIIETYKPEKMIIDGDFKHEFGKNLRQEWRETSEILQYLAGKTDIILIRGNHDNFLRTIASKFNVPVVNEYEAGNIKIVHGHKETRWNGMLIMAHEHPSIMLRDSVGAVVKLPCFIVGEKLIVLPALSPLATGTDVLSDDYLSPILKEKDTDDFEVYAISHDELLHFSKIGNLKKIM